MFPHRFLLVGFLVAACTQPVGERSDPIINGRSGAEHRAVVAVLNLSGTGGLCSGTLIGPYAVLTAKHCVYADRGDGIWEAIGAGSLRILVADDVNSAEGVEAVIPVSEWRSTPGVYTDRDLQDGQDIAVVLTTQPLTDIAPYGVSRTSPTAGQAAKVVGFGRSNPASEDESGVKLQADTSVIRAGNLLVEAGATRAGEGWTCQGDSGGPLLVGTQIAGVTSFGYNGCGARSQHYFTAVVRHLAMIDEGAAYRPPCEASEEICDGRDNDCDLEVDEVCTGLGDSCSAASECADERCEAVEGAGSVCVRTCEPSSPVPTCPFGFRCEVTGCLEGRCIPGAEGWIPDGDPCTLDTECIGGRCAPVAGALRCARPCDPAGPLTCREGLVCEPGEGCGGCIPAELSTVPRPYGTPCESDGQCASGDCTDGEGGSPFCTRGCAAGECGAGRHCREGRCVGGDLTGPGQGCLVGDDCALMADCIAFEGERLCALACTPEGTCDPDSVCEETEAGPRCVSEGIGLGDPCGENAECRSGICGGTCTRLCSESACPEGFECRAVGEYLACYRPESDEGGCAAVPGRPSAPVGAAVLGAFVALLAGRRRRR